MIDSLTFSLPSPLLSVCILLRWRLRLARHAASSSADVFPIFQTF